jgi:hypothetical protein
MHEYGKELSSPY